MTTTPALNPNPGRPSKHNWLTEKPELERLIAEGYGFYRLGKRYGITSTGMLRVLRRLGLKTLRQAA